jgi:hypothetical protein
MSLDEIPSSPHRAGRSLLRLAAACGCLLLAGSAPAASDPEAVLLQAPTARRGVPPSLEAVGEDGEEIYDLVQAKKWSKAQSRLRSLDKSMKAVRAEVKDAEVEKDRLASTITDLKKAIVARDRIESLMKANRVTLVAANMTVPYHPAVPVEVSLLDYYGRELQIWTELKNEDQDKEIATNVAGIWKSLRPKVVAAGGSKEAERFDGLVDELGKATALDAFKALATRLLDEVDRLEKVFTSPSRPAAGPGHSR